MIARILETIAVGARACRQQAEDLLLAAAVLVGFGLVLYGISILSRPAALIAGGVILVTVAFLYVAATARRPRADQPRADQES